jgi:hypothetical protein
MYCKLPDMRFLRTRVFRRVALYRWLVVFDASKERDAFIFKGIVVHEVCLTSFHVISSPCRCFETTRSLVSYRSAPIAPPTPNYVPRLSAQKCYPHTSILAHRLSSSSNWLLTFRHRRTNFASIKQVTVQMTQLSLQQS